MKLKRKLRKAYYNTRNFYKKVYNILYKRVYRLKCLVLPSYKFHIIKLANIDPTWNYTHGYLDPGDRMELAIWACFLEFAEEIKDYPQDLKDIHYPDIQEIYDWITVEKKKAWKAVSTREDRQAFEAKNAAYLTKVFEFRQNLWL